VRMLLDSKANVNACDNNGGTPLYIAASNGHIEVVKLLLDNKAEVNICRHSDDVTPLYIAAWKGHTEIVKLLLGKKAKVDARRADGDKPIDAARRYQHLEIVKLLQ